MPDITPAPAKPAAAPVAPAAAKPAPKPAAAPVAPVAPVAPPAAPPSIRNPEIAYRAVFGKMVHPRTLAMFDVIGSTPATPDAWLRAQVEAGKLVVAS